MKRSKGHLDAAVWPRPVASGTCDSYRATEEGCRQFKTTTVAVKLKCDLSIDSAEHNALDDWDAAAQTTRLFLLDGLVGNREIGSSQRELHTRGTAN